MEIKLNPMFQPLTPEEIIEGKRAYDIVADTIMEKCDYSWEQYKDLRRRPPTPFIIQSIEQHLAKVDECLSDYKIMKRVSGKIGNFWHFTQNEVDEAMKASRMKYKYQIVPEPQSSSDEDEEEEDGGSGFPGGRPRGNESGQEGTTSREDRAKE